MLLSSYWVNMMRCTVEFEAPHPCITASASMRTNSAEASQGQGHFCSSQGSFFWVRQPLITWDERLEVEADYSPPSC